MTNAPVLNGRHVEVTTVPCPTCKAQGHLNAGGNVPTLRYLPGEPDKLFCLTHGYPHRPFGKIVDGPLGIGTKHEAPARDHPEVFDVVICAQTAEGPAFFEVTDEVFRVHFQTEGFVVVQTLGTYEYDGDTEGFFFTPSGVTEETRAGVTARITSDESGVLDVRCVACNAALVDDDRSPFYDAATDDGTPHACPVTL